MNPFSPFGITILSLVILSLLGLPIGLSMISASIVYLLLMKQDLGIAGEQILQGLYNGYTLLAIPLFIFAADLIRAMHDTGLSPEVEFIFISSYGAGTTSGEVRVLRDIDNEVAGRDVLLIGGGERPGGVLSPVVAGGRHRGLIGDVESITSSVVLLARNGRPGAVGVRWRGRGGRRVGGRRRGGGSVAEEDAGDDQGGDDGEGGFEVHGVSPRVESQVSGSTVRPPMRTSRWRCAP